MTSHRNIRVLIAKLGLDYHDRGAKLIARRLRDAGMEVIYTGLFQTPEMVVKTAMQEDVDVIGISILSGAHSSLMPEAMDLLRDKGLAHIPVILGGIIPHKDIVKLKAMGVKEVFAPGTLLDTIAEYIKSCATHR